MLECNACGKSYEIGEWPLCPHGEPGPFWFGDHNIHTSEQVTLEVNPRTGDERVCGRADHPMHPKLAADGYVRKTLETHQEIRAFEKRKGLIHESSHYNRGSATAERDTGSI